MRARAVFPNPGFETSGLGPSGSNHTTTPEKSIFLRTDASRESRSSTLPATLAAAEGRAIRIARLKQVCDREIIVWKDPRPRTQVCGACLRGFESRHDVGPQPVH